MTDHPDACDFKRAFNMYTRGQFNRVIFWDKKDVAAFYEIDNADEDHRKERIFLHYMCAMLNKPEVEDFLHSQMRVRYHFDRLQGLEKNLVCRFELPCSEIKKRACVIFLYDMVENNHLRHFIEKVVFHGSYFAIFSPLG